MSRIQRRPQQTPTTSPTPSSSSAANAAKPTAAAAGEQDDNVDTFSAPALSPQMTATLDAGHDAPASAAGVEGAALRQHSLQAQFSTTTSSSPHGQPRFPDGLSDELKQATQQLWDAYAGDPKVKDAIEFVLEDSFFDPMLDVIPDEQRLGRLMGAIPLPAEVSQVPPLSFAVVEAHTTTSHQVKEPLKLLQEALAHSNADVVMAPEWFFVPDGRFFTADEFDDLCSKLQQMSAGSDRLLVPGTIAWVDDDGGYHNTALAFADGKLLKRCDKRHDGDDIDFAQQHGATYARGEGDAVFAWRGLTVGLEVCRDHGDATLRWDLEHAGGDRRTVDVQLVVSSGVDVTHTAIGVGGVVACANGDAVSDDMASTVGRRVPQRDSDHWLHASVDDAAVQTSTPLQGATLQTYTA